MYTVRKPTGSWAVALNGNLCSTSVMDIECQRADGSAAQLTGQVIHCKELVGVYCRNTEQTRPNKICDDYRFRFLCSNIERPGEFIDLFVFSKVHPDKRFSKHLLPVFPNRASAFLPLSSMHRLHYLFPQIKSAKKVSAAVQWAILKVMTIFDYNYQNQFRY